MCEAIVAALARGKHCMVEAGTGVALVPDFFADTAAGRVKLVRLVPEPESTIVSIAALKGKLSPAAETCSV